jgi:hypothetical protein
MSVGAGLGKGDHRGPPRLKVRRGSAEKTALWSGQQGYDVRSPQLPLAPSASARYATRRALSSGRLKRTLLRITDVRSAA